MLIQFELSRIRQILIDSLSDQLFLSNTRKLSNIWSPLLAVAEQRRTMFYGSTIFCLESTLNRFCEYTPKTRYFFLNLHSLTHFYPVEYKMGHFDFQLSDDNCRESRPRSHT